jgi:drug/metabolite transporter (DMT)-like permease
VLAIIGGLGAAVAWTATMLAAARGSRLIDPRSLLATVMTVGLVITLPAAFASGTPHIGARSGVWLAVSGLGNVLGLLLNYSALRIGKVGMVAPITSTEGAVAAVIAVFSGESLSLGTGVMLAVIAGGVALAANAPSGETRAHEVRAALFAGGAALSFGASLYATGKVGQDLGVAWAALPPRAVGVAVLALPLALSGRWHMTRSALPYAVVGGIFEVVGFVSYAFGARHGLAVAAVLASQFAGFAVVVAYFFLRERLTHVQVVGVAAIVVGVSILSALRVG